MSSTVRILVVEDDELVRSYVCTQLSRHGYRVIEAQNAAEALAHRELHVVSARRNASLAWHLDARREH